MPTVIYSKKEFIKMLRAHLPDNYAVLATQELSGTMSASKGGKKVQFTFSQSAFKKEGVGDFAFGDIRLMAVAVCNKADLSEDALKVLKQK